MILGIDTTGADLKMGLSHEGHVSVKSWSDGPRHSRTLLPQMLDFLNEENAVLEQLSALAFSQGPGSFTGLRVAVGVIQGLAYGLGLPVIEVPTMAVIALRAGRALQTDDVLVTVHARETEVYGGFYCHCRSGTPELVEGPRVYTRATLQSSIDKPWTLAGDGAFIFDDDPHPLLSRTDILNAGAEDLMLLAVERFEKGLTVSPLSAAPLYVRETVAAKSRS